jgi:putative ABC transport system permease protein
MGYGSPHVFSTVGIPILRGRDVAWTDLPDTTKVALLSESLARDLDVNGDVVGRSIDFASNAQRQRFQIVGIVGNISSATIDRTTSNWCLSPHCRRIKRPIQHFISGRAVNR